ncbi:MAG TPA: peptidoglycan-binding domain-containing protein [Candidatus Paceibacterota bacterium]|nr:peptidoglycan-binding domain-containing protein [Candidatus Paceibacterota bacterium]
MNSIISTNSVKVGVIAVAIIFTFVSVFVTQAAVTSITATVNGSSSASVATGDLVEVFVSADKGNVGGCENNWRSTVVKVDGIEVHEVHEEFLGSITGTGMMSDTFSFTAPAAPGEYTVTVDVMGGGESFGNTVCPDDQVWGSVELSLSVYKPVAPYINVLSISPENVVRTVGDNNGLMYEAEIEVGGVPTSAHLQCVMFDILFLNDGWNPVSVNFPVAGTYDVSDGISFLYDVSGYATGTYYVVAVGLDMPCDNLPNGFNTADYIDSDVPFAAATTLTIVDELVDTLVITNPAVDGDIVSGEVDFTAEYVDHDEVVDQILWAIRFETCAASTGTVAGNVDTFSDSSTFVGTIFTATVDVSGWAPGEYCFVVNPQEQDGEPDLREVRWFVIEETESGEEEGETPVIEESETSSNQTGTRLGSRSSLGSAPSGQVLGAATSAAQCGVLIFDYLRLGQAANNWEVMKLQMFLTGQGFFTPATGIFDTTTDANVRLFQAKYPAEILAPWGITEPTGYVYKTTLWKLNNIVCPGSQAMPTL